MNNQNKTILDDKMKGFSKNYEKDITSLTKQINSEDELKQLFDNIY